MKHAIPAVPIHALIFDLFGVVIAFDESSVYRRLAAFCKEPERALVALEGLVSTPALITGQLSLQALHRQLVAKQGLSLEFAALREEWLTPYTAPKRGMAQLLEDLSSSYKLILLSNVDRDYLQVVRRNHRELHHFAAQVVSCETGHAKPHAAAFAAALLAADEPPGACFFVDDKPENVIAAASVGIAGHEFTTAPRLRQALAQAGVFRAGAGAA